MLAEREEEGSSVRALQQIATQESGVKPLRPRLGRVVFNPAVRAETATAFTPASSLEPLKNPLRAVSAEISERPSN